MEKRIIEELQKRWDKVMRYKNGDGVTHTDDMVNYFDIVRCFAEDVLGKPLTIDEHNNIKIKE